MRRSDEDEYSARYASADSVAQWSSYATHHHGVALPSSNVRGSMTGAGSGYDNVVGTGHGMWMSHGHNNSGGSFARQDQSIYAQHHQNPGYHSSTPQRAQEQWCTPSGNYGRQGMEQTISRTSAPQTTWEQHHGHGRSHTYTPYDDGSNYTPFSSSTQQPSPPLVKSTIILPSLPPHNRP
ncbi:hypothetical protein JB92DRAFT_365713 [Gautieria morchelliformis]|nr:hypothetical protein JB92DRAFT_365713 [Gautieria morchelliformis]